MLWGKACQLLSLAVMILGCKPVDHYLFDAEQTRKCCGTRLVLVMITYLPRHRRKELTWKEGVYTPSYPRLDRSNVGRTEHF